MKAVLALSAVLMSQAASATPADLAKMNTSDFLMATGPTGCQAKGMKADARGEYLYVAEMCGALDPVTRKAIRDDQGNRVASVSMYNLRTLKLEKIIRTPRGALKGIIGNTEVDMTIDDKYVLVARAESDATAPLFPNGAGMVTAIRSDTHEVSKYIPVGGSGAKTIMRRPFVQGEGNRQIVYVANYFSDDVSVLDVSNLDHISGMRADAALIKRVKVKSAFINPSKVGYKIAPRGMAFTPDGKFAIILATETGSVIVMDSVNHVQLAELPPMPTSIAGREVNVRHIVTTNDGEIAYLSHMRGNAISRISVEKLISMARVAGGQVLPVSAWNELLIPFANGKKLIDVIKYPKDHPNFANKTWEFADPNTIVLDPVNNRYLYVSNRTRTAKDYNIIDKNIKGKVDVIDTNTGNIIFTLAGGAQPTALEVSPDNRILISAGFKDDTIYFYDLQKMISIYESGQVRGLR
jgi:DNA-binding beta-propeller fold protein YncE